jgi:flagellar basal-body rod modification protein FlgD
MPDPILPAVSTPVTSAPSPVAATAAAASPTLASNFTAFLQLLTTQLKNQNPLDPLDTNQFTQQLVQFAQVEQQLKANEQLAALVEIEKGAQTTTALAFVGMGVVIEGSSTRLNESSATWFFAVDKPASATVNIMNSAGQVVYTTNMTINPGTQQFTWDGKDKNGVQWPDGEYKISVVAKDAAGQSVAVSTEVAGIVESVDLTKQPPLLSMAGQDFTMAQVRRIIRPGGA